MKVLFKFPQSSDRIFQHFIQMICSYSFHLPQDLSPRLDLPPLQTLTSHVPPPPSPLMSTGISGKKIKNAALE